MTDNNGNEMKKISKQLQPRTVKDYEKSLEKFNNLNKMKKYNLVRCGNCSHPFAHEICEYEEVKCSECREVMNKSDCPDFDVGEEQMKRDGGSGKYAFLSDLLLNGFEIAPSTPSGWQLLENKRRNENYFDSREHEKGCEDADDYVKSHKEN